MIHLVKWGPFYDSGERELSYTILPPPTGSSGQISFTGIGSFDGANVTVSGNPSIKLSSQNNPRASLTTVDPYGPIFQLSGRALTDYVIEASVDLIHWEVLERVSTGAQGSYLFTPRNLDQPEQRYFRARREQEPVSSASEPESQEREVQDK